jgi:hypothetical protein
VQRALFVVAAFQALRHFAGQGCLKFKPLILRQVAIAALLCSAPATAQMQPAPYGNPVKVAMEAIKLADHPCGAIKTAIRLSEGNIRAVCTNGEAYRVFMYSGELVAMRCSAAKRMGVGGC